MGKKENWVAIKEVFFYKRERMICLLMKDLFSLINRHNFRPVFFKITMLDRVKSGEQFLVVYAIFLRILWVVWVVKKGIVGLP